MVPCLIKDPSTQHQADSIDCGSLGEATNSFRQTCWLEGRKAEGVVEERGWRYQSMVRFYGCTNGREIKSQAIQHKMVFQVCWPWPPIYGTLWWERVRKIWGGYSPKVYDSHLIEANRDWFEDKLKGAEVVADQHFCWGVKHMWATWNRTTQSIEARKEEL